jgi:hypothetical protein
MGEKVTDVSISVFTSSASIYTEYAVEFYSTRIQDWISFHYTDWYTQTNIAATIEVISPKHKKFDLSSSGDKFKVGKIPCRVYWKRSIKTTCWEFDGEGYYVQNGQAIPVR